MIVPKCCAIEKHVSLGDDKRALGIQDKDGGP